MKSGNNRSKYDTVIKPLKIQRMSDFDLVNFSKWYHFDTKKSKKQTQKWVVELRGFASGNYWPKSDKEVKLFGKPSIVLKENFC